MKRRVHKMIGLIVVLIIGVFVGLEWAQSGIERVHGPWDSSRQSTDQTYIDDRSQQTSLQTAQSGATVRNTSTSDGQPDEIWIDIDRKPVRYVRGDQVSAEEQSLLESELTVQEEPLTLSQPPASDAPVNQLADKAAGMLQQLSEAGMKAVVGVFSGMF